MNEHKLGDYDIWFKACNHCGYDTAKATKKTSHRCWKCGRGILRDFSDRALKVKKGDDDE